MSFSVRIVADELSPRFRALRETTRNLRPILEAAGLQVVSLTQRAFRDASLRQSAWAPKRDGSPARLMESGTLWRSIRVTAVTSNTVTVGTDRVYAAAHQFGATIKPKPGNKFLVFNIGGRKVFARKVTIPPRPFFPITGSGALIPEAQQRVMRTVKTALGLGDEGSATP